MPVEHKCHRCHKVLTRSTILRDHLRSHEGDRTFKCAECGRAFVRDNDRKNHEKTHTKDHKYVCYGIGEDGTTCGAKFHRKHDLDRHRKRKGGAKRCLRRSLGSREQEVPQSTDASINISASSVSRRSTWARVGSTMIAAELPSVPGPSADASLDRPALPTSPQPLSSVVNPERPSAIFEIRPPSPRPISPINFTATTPAGPQLSSLRPGNRDCIQGIADPERRPGSGTRRRRHRTTFECDFCRKPFSVTCNLHEHPRSHTVEKPFACTVCYMAFIQIFDPIRRRGLHQREVNFICKGELISRPGHFWGCGRRFVGVDAFDRHLVSEAGRLCVKPLLDEGTVERVSRTIGLRQDTHEHDLHDPHLKTPPQPVLDQNMAPQEPPSSVMDLDYFMSISALELDWT